MRRPKSNLSRCRSNMLGSLCAAVNISRDSSYALNILAVAKRKMRKRASSQTATKNAPSLLMLSETAWVWFFRSSYKCVSLLKEKRSLPGRVSSVGICKVSGSQSSNAPVLSALRQVWMTGLYLMECAGAEWTSSVRTGSGLPLSGERMCTRPESATETATNAAGEFFLCTNSAQSGLKGSLSMLVMSNAATSYSLRALSSPTVASNRPSCDKAMASKVPMCDRKCLTNSMPSYCFFQNLMWPSTLPVTRKPVEWLEMAKLTVSLCMKLFSYISAFGKLSR
mmetsp:Transcript_100143/g.266194  ORF Transcript_100143/g.266194 Transcript_100143/m.266194 type:complete len:281 (-) Transcript_100143:372-1214(-)